MDPTYPSTSYSGFENFIPSNRTEAPNSQVTLTSADSSCRGIPSAPRVDFALGLLAHFLLCFGPCVSHTRNSSQDSVTKKKNCLGRGGRRSKLSQV
ncbi:hypothetical protein Q8A67_003329 [Cirrhinus molitorella]|uniref:Uncharacterized protein n=1 Tax=Cirrhinus molitorella TaxID=172907 RepID=A0AA88QF17_9TELE|nr:hypothetical protein Q8A67_003329 [Cirrhinus molitorella]